MGHGVNLSSLLSRSCEAGFIRHASLLQCFPEVLQGSVSTLRHYPPCRLPGIAIGMMRLAYV